jgi:AcrR family transcriptional regulator
MPRPRAAPTPAPDVARLGRDDWLDAAFRAVVDGGFDAMRVLTLARALGVTRGSFYWHFADHAALRDAVIERWRARELDTVARLAAESDEDPRADLLRVLDVALARGRDDLADMRFELALRGLGRRDAAVARVLVAIDEARMDVFESKFLRLTGDARRAADLAALFYLAITGAVQALARPSSTARVAEYLRALLADHVIDRHPPQGARAGRRRRDPA